MRKSQKKEGPGARKGRKVAKRCVFPMICGSGGSKSRLAKAAGAGPCGQMRDEKLHAVVAQSTFPIQNAQSTSASELFWSWDVEKVHSVVARSTFPSPNVQNTAASEPFGSWDVQKVYAVVARSNMSKSKVQKIEGYGALLDVQMSFRVAGARDCAPCQKWAKHEGCVAVSKTMAGVGHVQRIR